MQHVKWKLGKLRLATKARWTEDVNEEEEGNLVSPPRSPFAHQ